MDNEVILQRAKMKRKWKILSFLGVCSQEVIWFFCYCLIVTLMFGGVTEAAPGGACQVKAGFNVKSVTPTWEEAVPVMGCYLGSITGRNQEVHVLHLKDGESWSPSSVVTVHVRPATEYSFHARPFVIVLHSDFEVSWRIVGDGLHNGTNNQLIVTKGSQLIETVGVQVVVQRRDIGRARHLLSWVSKRFKTFTSYSAIDRANNVLLKVGATDELNTTENCDVSNRDRVPICSASLKEVILGSKRRGCMTHGARGGTNSRAVYVVKIHEVQSDSVGLDTPLRVKLRVTTKHQRNISRDVGLVLQTLQPVEWLLTVDTLQGRVDVVTEGRVIGSPSNRPHVLSVRTEPLPTSTQELLIYARDWFGPSYVFTELWRANGIEIYLDESNEADSTEKPAVPYQSDNYWESGHSVGGNHRPRAVDNQELLKLHLDDASHPFQPELKETHVLIKPRATAKLKADFARLPTMMLMNVMTVECLPRRMQVSFPRPTVEKLGLAPEDVSLLFSHCSVTPNETHYVLSTPFHYCGTKQEIVNDKVIYRNAVHFHFKVLKKTSGSSLMSENSRLPVDDEDGEYGSGGSSTEVPMPVTKLEQSQFLQFHCEYISPEGPSHTQREVSMTSSQSARDVTTLTASRELFSMELFRDPSFLRSIAIQEYPFVAFERETLYVQTNLSAGVLHVVTEECWLSGEADVSSVPLIYLLKNSCPAHSTVRIESTSDIANNRFSFELIDKYLAPHLFLHCRLGVCSADKAYSNRRGLKMCIDQKDYCSTESLRAYLELPRGTHHTTFSRGPFHVKRKPPPVSQTNPFASYVPISHVGTTNTEVLTSETTDIRCTVPEQQSVIVLGLSTEAAVGVAFASFVIGLSLSAILWCIYLKTDPLRSVHRRPTHNSGYDLSAHSGSSTPSSQSPMTA